MPRSTRAVFQLNTSGSLAPPFTQFDNVNNEQFYNSGAEAFIIWNKDAAVAAVITFRSVGDPYGRTSDLAVSVPSAAGGGTIKIAGPFPPEAWNQAATGLLNVDYTSGTAASILAAVLRS